MTMDVSRLAVVVESTGIKEASTSLQGRNGNGGLAGAAARAERNVAGLTAGIGRLLSMNTGASMNAWASAMGQLNTALGNIAATATATANAMQQTVNGLNNLTQATNQANRANESYSRGSHVVMNTLKALATVSTVYTAINVAGSIIKQADAWQMMQARLQNATGSLNNAKVAQQDMYELAQRLRVPLEDQVRLYTRMAPAMQRMGKTADQTRNTVEGIATALQLGGANGAEMSSVMLQLSQSYSSGVLNGAEFNAVAENGSVIMRALEAYTGKSTYQLKKLGSEGKLSVDILNKAIEANLPAWREQFDRLPVTFEGAVQRIKNAWTKAIGDMGQDTKFNQELSQSLRIVEEMIPAVAKGLGEAFISVMNWIKENKKVLGEIWNQVSGLILDVYNVAKAFLSWTAAIIGAGDEVSIVSAAIFAIRFALAAIVDGTKMLGWAFANVGLDVAQFFLTPVVWVFEKIGDIHASVGKIFELAARGARAFGNNELADGLETAAAAARNSAYNSFEMADKIKGLVEAGRASADSWIVDIKNGEGALAKLFDTTKKVSEETEKVKGAMDGSRKTGAPAPAIDEKAAKAAAAERKRFDEAMIQAKTMLEEQERLNASLSAYGLAYEKIGPAQKKVIELTERQAKLERDSADATTIVHNLMLLKVYEEAAAIEKKNEHLKESLQLQEKIMNAQGASVKAVQDEADKAEAKLAQYGEPKGTDQLLEIQRVKESIAVLDATSDASRTANLEVMLAMLRQELEARERIYSAEFEKLMDPKKAEKFGDVLANGFGKAGKALGQLIKSTQAYEVRMSKVGKAWELVNKETDPTKKAKMSAQAAELEQEAWITTYADMAGAAKGFFEEGSRGYKVLEAAEKTFRAFEIAMSLKSFAEKSGLLTAFTSLFIASKAEETAAEAASVAPHVAAEGAKAGASGISALAGTLASLPFPANIAAFAVVAALLAGIGVAIGGGGGGSSGASAEQRQAKQGTGTVFGDSEAKSESISKSLEYLSENSDIALRYSSGMLSSLQSIEKSLTGAVNGIVRSGGDITGKGFLGSAGGASFLQSATMLGFWDKMPMGDLLTKLSGFGSKTKLLDSGITSGNQTVGDVLSGGFEGKSYQDIQKEKKAFFITYSKSTSRTMSDLDPAINDEFTRVIESMVGSVTTAAEALGMSADEVQAKISEVTLSLGDISLKGLSAEEIQAELEAVFSAFGDSIVEAGLGESVSRFQQAGEGLLETAIRVASGVEQADYELEKLGLTAIDFSDIINTSGDVGGEIVKQSILMQEAGTGVGEIIDQMSGTASDIASVYKDLVGVRESLQLLGIADDVSRDLIRAAGGLSAMQDALASYADNFFSDAERQAMNVSKLGEEFGKLGLSMPQTKADFRALVESLSATGAEGQETAMKVLLLADSFAQVTETSEALIEDARSNLSDAYERESQALIDVKDRFEEFAKSLSEFKNTLMTGDLSTLNPLEKYQADKARFEDVASRAAAGDESALAEFETVATDFLNSSRDVFASGDQYTEDFNRVLSETSALEVSTTGQVTMAEQQLEALNAQVAGLIEVNDSVLSVADAVAELQALMAGGFNVTTDAQGTQTIMPVVDGSHASGLGYVPFDGYVAELHKGEAVLTATENKAYQMDYSQYGRSNNVALVEEVKSLRQQVAELCAEQREQTGQLIAAQYGAAERNAEAIVEGQSDVARTTSYTERAKVALV